MKKCLKQCNTFIVKSFSWDPKKNLEIFSDLPLRDCCVTPLLFYKTFFVTLFFFHFFFLSPFFIHQIQYMPFKYKNGSGCNYCKFGPNKQCIICDPHANNMLTNRRFTQVQTSNFIERKL